MVLAEAHAIPIHSDNAPLVTWILRESSRRQMAEQDLRAALATAEREQLATGVFLDLMSHELRTPLQAVPGDAGMLLRAAAGSLTDEQREDIGYIHRAGIFALPRRSQHPKANSMQAQPSGCTSRVGRQQPRRMGPHCPSGRRGVPRGWCRTFSQRWPPAGIVREERSRSSMCCAPLKTEPLGDAHRNHRQFA
jgi:hypothetical protein